jgi:hypothetical protein
VYIACSDDLVEKCIKTKISVAFGMKYNDIEFKKVLLTRKNTEERSGTHIFRVALNELETLQRTLKLKMTHDVWFVVIVCDILKDKSVVVINQDPREDYVLYNVAKTVFAKTSSKPQDLCMLKGLNDSLTKAFSGMNRLNCAKLK